MRPSMRRARPRQSPTVLLEDRAPGSGVLCAVVRWLETGHVRYRVAPPRLAGSRRRSDVAGYGSVWIQTQSRQRHHALVPAKIATPPPERLVSKSPPTTAQTMPRCVNSRRLAIGTAF